MMFPRSQMGLGIQKGDVVSLDKNGKLRKGAGTTIYHNVQQIHNKTLYHLHTVVIGDSIHVAQYDSEMLVTVINPETDAILATQTVRLFLTLSHSLTLSLSHSLTLSLSHSFTHSLSHS